MLTMCCPKYVHQDAHFTIVFISADKNLAQRFQPVNSDLIRFMWKNNTRKSKYLYLVIYIDPLFVSLVRSASNHKSPASS